MPSLDVRFYGPILGRVRAVSTMNWKILLVAAICLLILTCVGLTLSNPSLAQYRQSILTGMARQEAAHQEQMERQAVEREAASLESYFSAAHYEGSRLDTLTVQRQYPRLGPVLVTELRTSGATLSERLAQIKQRALQRITVTRETIQYSLLADLATHTTRTSYGLWSSFSTCHNNRLSRHRGLAGRFLEEEPGTCIFPR
jgi:hypothetical protein